MVFDIFNVFNFIEAIWFILPAYAANGLIPIFKGKHPIDFGRKFRGKPILGPGKTWEGLLFGSIIGMLIAFIQLSAYPYLPWELSEVPLTIIPMSIQLGFLLGFGTVIGDMCGSIIKRRLNLRRGRPAPILDQDDFIVGAFVFAGLLIAFKWQWVVLMLILTPIFHLLASVIGYLAHIKREPY